MSHSFLLQSVATSFSHQFLSAWLKCKFVKPIGESKLFIPCSRTHQHRSTSWWKIYFCSSRVKAFRQCCFAKTPCLFSFVRFHNIARLIRDRICFPCAEMLFQQFLCSFVAGGREGLRGELSVYYEGRGWSTLEFCSWATKPGSLPKLRYSRHHVGMQLWAFEDSILPASQSPEAGRPFNKICHITLTWLYNGHCCSPVLHHYGCILAILFSAFSRKLYHVVPACFAGEIAYMNHSTRTGGKFWPKKLLPHIAEDPMITSGSLQLLKFTPESMSAVASEASPLRNALLHLQSWHPSGKLPPCLSFTQSKRKQPECDQSALLVSNVRSQQCGQLCHAALKFSHRLGPLSKGVARSIR